MNIFELLKQVLDWITSYFAQGNKRSRQRKRIEKKAFQGFRQFAGYPLDDSKRLTSDELDYVLLPDSQSAAEAYAKLVGLQKNEKYSLLLLWCWVAEHGKTCRFISPPRIE